MTIDKVDRQILGLMQENNRVGSDAIAAAVGLSSTAVQRRLSKLRKDKVIQQDISVVSPEQVGRSMCFIVEVTLEKESVQLLDQFKRQMREEPEVQQCYYISGRVDFMLILNLQDMSAYEEFTRRVIFNNSNVRRFETNVVMNRVKVSLTVPLDD